MDPSLSQCLLGVLQTNKRIRGSSSHYCTGGRNEKNPKQSGRVDQAMDLSWHYQRGGCPVPSRSLRRGGNHERMQRRSYATRSRNEIFGHPSFTFTGPASSKR